jgi:hypothetical protein
MEQVNLILFIATIVFAMILISIGVVYLFIASWVKFGVGVWLGKKRNYMIHIKRWQSGFTEILAEPFPKEKTIWYGEEYKSFPVEIDKVYAPQTNLGLPVILSREGIPKNIDLGEKSANLKDQKIFNQAVITSYNTGIMRAMSNMWDAMRQNPWVFYLVIFLALASVFIGVTVYNQGASINEMKEKIGTIYNTVVIPIEEGTDDTGPIQEGAPTQAVK